MGEKNKMTEVTEMLEKGIQEVFESEQYKDYLKFLGKFHNYSFGNVLLIKAQFPAASCVAGYKAWQTKFKRQVKKGEKGIAILAPAPYKVTVAKEKLDPQTKKPELDPDGNPILIKTEVTRPHFRVVYIFDVSQTEGEPLPTLVPEIVGNVDKYPIFLESLKKVSPYPIYFEEIKGMAKGYCDYNDKKIVIEQGLSELQSINIGLHEIAHAYLHSQKNLPPEQKKPRRTREIEAESVAFVVCNHFGLDTGDQSFGYIAGWSKDKELKQLKSSLETIQRQAAELISKIETNYRELQRAQEARLDTVRFDNEIDLDRVKTPVAERIITAQDKINDNDLLPPERKEPKQAEREVR